MDKFMDSEQNTLKDLHFKGQYPEEVVYAFFRHHWVSLLPGILMLAVFIFLLLGFWIFFSQAGFNPAFKPVFQVAIVFAVPLLSYFIHTLFIEIVKHFLQTVIITNFRIVDIKKTILMKDSQDAVSIETIQDIKKQQNGFWKNILGFGELKLMLSSSDVKTITFVPNPNYHFRLICRVKQQHATKALPEDETFDRIPHNIFQQHFDSFPVYTKIMRD